MNLQNLFNIAKGQPLEDENPKMRILTGDCRITVRKETVNDTHVEYTKKDGTHVEYERKSGKKKEEQKEDHEKKKEGEKTSGQKSFIFNFHKPKDLKECITYKEKLLAAKETQNEGGKGWRVDISHEPEDYKNDKIIMTPGGSVAAVTPSGDIISVCKNKNDVETKGSKLLEEAVKAGGKKLDSYDGNYNFYVDNGFEPVSYCLFNEEYAPDGWDASKHRKEPVVFFKYVGKDKVKYKNSLDFYKNVKMSKDYDEAQALRDQEV